MGAAARGGSSARTTCARRWRSSNAANARSASFTRPTRRSASKVEILARFPGSTHKPIVYPFAAVKGARPATQAFLRFVETSPTAAAIFDRYGFTRLKR